MGKVLRSCSCIEDGMKLNLCCAYRAAWFQKVYMERHRKDKWHLVVKGQPASCYQGLESRHRRIAGLQKNSNAVYAELLGKLNRYIVKNLIGVCCEREITRTGNNSIVLDSLLT
jgi:hypothetical protein